MTHGTASSYGGGTRRSHSHPGTSKSVAGLVALVLVLAAVALVGTTPAQAVSTFSFDAATSTLTVTVDDGITSIRPQVDNGLGGTGEISLQGDASSSGAVVPADVAVLEFLLGDGNDNFEIGTTAATTSFSLAVQGLNTDPDHNFPDDVLIIVRGQAGSDAVTILGTILPPDATLEARGGPGLGDTLRVVGTIESDVVAIGGSSVRIGARGAIEFSSTEGGVTVDTGVSFDAINITPLGTGGAPDDTTPIIVDAGAGLDTVLVVGRVGTAGITVNGGNPSFGDVLLIEDERDAALAGADLVTITNAAITVTGGPLAGGPVNYQRFEELTFRSGFGNDVIDIDSIGPGFDLLNINVGGGAASGDQDIVNVDLDQVESSLRILGAVPEWADIVADPLVGPGDVVNITTAGASAVTIGQEVDSGRVTVTRAGSTASLNLSVINVLNVTSPGPVIVGDTNPQLELNIAANGGPLTAHPEIVFVSSTGAQPASSPLAGGTPVDIFGTNLEVVTGIRFGAVAAAFTLDDEFHLTATAPPGVAVGDMTVFAQAPGAAGTLESLPVRPPDFSVRRSSSVIAPGFDASTTFTYLGGGSSSAPAILGALPDQVTTEGVPIGPLDFSVADATTPAVMISVSATAVDGPASASPLIAVASVPRASGPDGSHELTITPLGTNVGSSIVTISATDTDGNIATRSFEVIVPANGNTQPLAADDFYATAENQDLTVNAAAGVLANDSDAETTAATALLVDDSSLDGTLTAFNADVSALHSRQLTGSRRSGTTSAADQPTGLRLRGPGYRIVDLAAGLGGSLVRVSAAAARECGAGVDGPSIVTSGAKNSRHNEDCSAWPIRRDRLRLVRAVRHRGGCLRVPQPWDGHRHSR